MFGLATRLRTSHTMRAYHQPAVLPYKVEDGLTPFLSPAALDFLYNMRQVELINNANRLSVGTELENKTLYDTIMGAVRDPKLVPLTNNASQAWNIDFFLQSLTNTAQDPSSTVERVVGARFGGFEKFKASFTQSALAMFGNGWTWLVVNESGTLSVLNTFNAGCPFVSVSMKANTGINGVTYASIQRAQNQRTVARVLPVLGLSMWQEAYIPDYGLDRAAYVNNFWKVINWERVEQRQRGSGIMNPRRRTTMNIGDGSGIPQPSLLRGPRASMVPSMFSQAPPSAMKPPRKTEAPGAQTPARGLFGNPPMSHMRNPARLTAQTPATNRVNRRVSVFASSRRTTMSLAVPGTASRNNGVKDPRPLKDRSFQSKAQQRIMNYLSTHGYPGVLAPKTLATPTVKDFQNIFKFLYAQLDPRYAYMKKIEEDVLQILRGIFYPYVSNISKSHIYSAGSLSTWPGLLAMLLWLVELIECVDEMNPQNVDFNDPSFKDSVQFVDRVFFDYLVQAYPVWLDSGDEPAELEDYLANQFEQKNASLIQETTEVERQLANAKAELDALVSNESPLVLLERERVELISDKEKFDIYIQRLECKQQRMTDYVATQKQQQDAAQFEQLALEKEKAEVQEIVDAQQISTEDVDRMNSERNQLLETLKGVQEKLQEAMQGVWDKELKLQRVLDDIESQAQEYTSKALKLGLIGTRKFKMVQPLDANNGSDSTTPESDLPKSTDDPLGGTDIELVINTRTEDRKQVASVDLRRDVRPALQRACDAFASQLFATQNAVLELREKIDQLSESRMEQQERVDEVEKQVKRHNQRYLELRDTIAAEGRASTAKVEQLEADIAAMRRETSQGELQSRAAIAHAEAEWESVQRGCRVRRSEISEDIMTILEDVVQMKSHAEMRVRELQQLVENDGVN
ncbi:kinetochore-associated Ndc80 complex subunit ndc80 [Coemansia sp. RSA 1822]|nr:kinetochore-associated Ndc80 complex subunit ndc80 [Coemansia sp. RSA 1822]